MKTRSSGGESWRILIIESDAHLAHAFQTCLKALGHTSAVAYDPVSALAMFKLGQFDVVTTASEVGLTSGLALAESIKDLSPRQPIILLTGYQVHRWSTQQLACVDAILTKPFTLEELSRVIRGLKATFGIVKNP